jgi:hypothetical protein
MQVMDGPSRRDLSISRASAPHTIGGSGNTWALLQRTVRHRAPSSGRDQMTKQHAGAKSRGGSVASIRSSV